MESIGAMKMEVMLRRSKFRDYYDIYSILKEGKDLQKMIDAALDHSGHKLLTRGLLAMLTNGSHFIKEKGFEELLPVYDVTLTIFRSTSNKNYSRSNRGPLIRIFECTIRPSCHPLSFFLITFRRTDYSSVVRIFPWPMT